METGLMLIALIMVLCGFAVCFCVGCCVGYDGHEFECHKEFNDKCLQNMLGLG
ncbi:hypothetical protein MP638_003862, partial [Amoeboaphelidium occidentale]